ncbi:MAG: MBL fold metallo-hydrolase [Candidatus Verstraetearchaeota archaeon]|nr:MBL fold metallo-hydrolase [Candidatus Verstraetearchaeota archaeon]
MMARPPLQPITSRAGRFLAIYEESFVGIGISSNVYAAESGGRHYIFDASGHPDLLSYLNAAGIPSESIAAVFLTHGHHDHVRGLVSLSRIGVPAYLNMNDLGLLENCIGKRDVRDVFEGNDILSGLGLRIIPTPGHTPGSTCYYSGDEGLLISGDTVYADGYFGRTDLPGGSDSEMEKSLKRLMGLGVHSILPGHGAYIMEGGGRSISVALSNANFLLR